MGGMSAIPYRLALQQRMLPNYRAPFFEALGAACSQGLSIFAGLPLPAESVEVANQLQNARLVPAGNIHLLRGPFYFLWQTGLLAWLEEWQPQALILEANPRYLSTSRAMAWMRRRGRPLVGWGLGAPPASGFTGRTQAAIWRRFLSRFDALIAYSHRGAGQYASLGFHPDRIFVAPNAVAPAPTHPAPSRPDRFENDRPVVLYVGRLQPRKRIDLLLGACAALPARLQPELWIVGDGPARPGLETLAGSVYPAAQFFGARYDSELEPFFQRADLFVLPGTGGLAVQQAMSYALPVIVAEADGTQSNLVHPENGWVLPAGDQPALTAALQEALQNPARLRQMGLSSYQIVAQEVNLDTMLAAFSTAITAAVEHTRHR